MSQKNIFVVDDEKDILKLLEHTLGREGYRVIARDTGEGVIKEIAKIVPDLVILDVMLPHTDGMEICRRLKGDPQTSGIPVIMLTARGEDVDVVSGLELGANDYVTKPFSPRVLVARVRSLLRRDQEPVGDSSIGEVKVHDIVIRPGRREVTAGDRPVDLTFSEFQILMLLAKKPGWVFSRYQIVDEVRGDDYPVTERSIDVQIVGLRKKLGDSGKYIETVRGVGYRMKG